MTKTSHFDEMCSAVRFQLDEPATTDSQYQRHIADFVARVSSTALQVRETTVPHVFHSVQRVIKRLEIEANPEVFIENDQSTNAYALITGTTERLIVVLNSGLVNLLKPQELDFVIGHELGHLGMRHIGNTPTNTPHSEFAFLKHQSTSRCREVSADRIGLLGTRSINIAAQVIMALASGLSSEYLNLDVTSFIEQLDRSPGEMSRDWELAMSHPSMPLRLWSLIRFTHSKTYNTLSGNGSFGDTLETLEDEIVERFNLLGDGQLSKYEDRCYSTAVLWTGLMMIMEDSLIETREQEALANLVGQDQAEKAIRFASDHGKDAVRIKHLESLEELRQSSLSTRKKYMKAAERFSEIVNVSVNDIIDLSQFV